jgi:hypothetical protein
MTNTTMKTRVMHTVHTVLQKSGQTIPAKHISISENSLQVYDVEHWPESFNSLLVHDFPSIMISIDSSTASISGFVITMQWNPVTDISQWVSIGVHICAMCVLLTTLTCLCFTALQQVSVDEIERIRSMYILGYNATVHEFGVYGPSSLLTDELRAVMAHRDM